MPYEVGRYYVVPHVRAAYPSCGTRGPWWVPVLGPMHEDGEILRFPHYHYHVDFRFLPAKARWLGALGESGHEVFRTPITHAWPVGWAQALSVEALVAHGGIDGAWVWYSLRRSKCKAEWPGYPVRAPWLRELQDRYEGEMLAGGHCPHRGVDLSTFEAGEDGCVTCPLHGLKWRLEDGAMVRWG